MNNECKEAREQVRLAECQRRNLIRQLTLRIMDMDVGELLCRLRSDKKKFGSNDKLILDVEKLINEIHAEARHKMELGNDITPLQDLLREVCIAYENSSVCPIDVQSFRDKLYRSKGMGIWDYILLLLVVVLLCGAGYLSFLALRWCFTTHPVLSTFAVIIAVISAWHTEIGKCIITCILCLVMLFLFVCFICGNCM